MDDILIWSDWRSVLCLTVCYITIHNHYYYTYYATAVVAACLIWLAVHTNLIPIRASWLKVLKALSHDQVKVFTTFSLETQTDQPMTGEWWGRGWGWSEEDDKRASRRTRWWTLEQKVENLRHAEESNKCWVAQNYVKRNRSSSCK